MRNIQCLKDFNQIEKVYPSDFIQYLRNEFFSLFEYLSNGESEDDFILPLYQSIVIMEESIELENSLASNLEYIEEISLVVTSCLRIGIYNSEDVQLHYYLLSKPVSK
ncbi:hypothetical protein [Bacillus atrophaeus]|uniref:hypothetical protein n=1 Tax=Bacillus atrophaeus TaxID=1452 RepID=UPI002282A377|nr:hypothetical protein [Bacillus atrophaeus]MCY8921145.1 hypothetical protein [Bacillus atrophaeus]MCY9166296.1 hypothetical protein [Bacillus atrophaeus]